MNLLSEECIICYEELRKDEIYAMIDHPGENGKYHVHCIESWLNRSTNGILIQNPIEKLNLYMDDKQISQMRVYVPEPLTPYEHLDLCCKSCCVIM